jgi:5'-3' exonuclease
MNIIFDGNYVMHKTFSIFTTYYRGKDMCEVLRNKDNQQILLRKCIMDLCYTVRKFNNVQEVVVVFDSHSWRYELYDNYKYALTRVREPVWEQFNEMLNMFEAFLRRKGLIVSRTDGAEGDDLMYIWSMYYGSIKRQPVTIVTGDSDLRQLITRNISVYNNNSKNLKMFCDSKNVDFWIKSLQDVEVIGTQPFDVLLYKIIVGDTSDNIPKLKKGFGPSTFTKFMNGIQQRPERFEDVAELTSWVFHRFCEFEKTEEDRASLKAQILFNIRMTWLNLATYENCGDKIKIPLLQNMIDDLNAHCNDYNYNKPYTLEAMYGMLIK